MRKYAFYKCLYQIGLIQICLLFLIADIYGQTYISPQVGVAQNTIANNHGQFIFHGTYLEDREPSYSVGLEVSHVLNKKLVIKFNTRFERLETRPDAITEVGVLDDGTTIISLNEFNPEGVVFRRYHYGFGFNFELLPKLKIVSSLSLVQTSSTKWLDQGRLEDVVLKSNELESNVELGLSYQFKSISVIPFYRHGFWHNDNGEAYEIDPVNAVGVRLGYQFKLLNKGKRKNKIDCPKL